MKIEILDKVASSHAETTRKRDLVAAARIAREMFPDNHTLQSLLISKMTPGEARSYLADINSPLAVLSASQSNK